MDIEFWWRNLKRSSGDTGIDGRIILKFMVVTPSWKMHI
jgi:hypothetical protein